MHLVGARRARGSFNSHLSRKIVGVEAVEQTSIKKKKKSDREKESQEWRGRGKGRRKRSTDIQIGSCFDAASRWLDNKAALRERRRKRAIKRRRHDAREKDAAATKRASVSERRTGTGDVRT